MFGKELEIIKYPYLGSSPNLMEYFSIIGYDSVTLENSKELMVDKMNIKPSILSSICSRQDYGIVDNDLIIRQVYPENPKFYTKNIQGQKASKPPCTSVIYSFCFDSINGKNKLFYVCYALKFYEEYSYLYVPKAFCIVSQYPYFTLFDYICKNIYSQYDTPRIKKNSNNDNEKAPIEIVLYHMVNYTPSPLKYSLNYTIFGQVNNASMTINQLSGYPYFDIDVYQIFSLLSIENIIKIFVLTVIEQRLLFFSSNLEILSITMFIFYALNYPCNDSTYFWHIVSVSQSTLEDPNNCDNNNGKFVQKIMSSLLGVNCTFNESIKHTEFSKCCYVVDLDNKKLTKKVSGSSEDKIEKEEFRSIEKLMNYLDEIMNPKKTVSSKFLSNIVSKLYRELNNIFEKNNDKKDSNLKFTTYLNTNQKIKENNRAIQEAFYDFYLSILMIFYQDNTLSVSFDKIIKDNDSNSDKLYFLQSIQNTDKMSQEEVSFCNEFKDSIKYKIYLENYIQDANCLDVYKIPLMFSEEFINMKIRYTKLDCKTKINYFSWIDKFYMESNAATLGIKLNSIHTEFAESFGKYCKNLKQEDSAVLNKRLINKYINYVLNNELDVNSYPYLSILEQTKAIDKINRRKISDIIEKELIDCGIIDQNGLLFYSSIYIFSMLIYLNDQGKMMNYLTQIRDCFSTLPYFTRKYIYIILMTLYKYMLVHKKTNKFPNMAPNRIKMYFFVLVNYLRQTMIIPNEEMMALLQTFFKQYSDDNVEGQEDDDPTEEDVIDISDKEIFQLYMPYCFNEKGIISQKQIVKFALNKAYQDNICIDSVNIVPQILIRIKGYETISKMYSAGKIYRLSQQYFWTFYENANLDISIINQEELKNLMTNLILYGYTISQLAEPKKEKGYFTIPYLYLINYLYLILEKEKSELNNQKEPI